MPLIHCPKCNKDISGKVKICPNCGYRFEKTGRKLSFVLISFVFVLLLGLCILFFLKPSDLLLVSVQIDSLGEIDSNSEEAISQAEENYKNLNSFQKVFITNYDDLRNARMEFDALPVRLTIDNIDEYITFNISYSNYENNSTMYPIDIDASVILTVNYSSRKDVVYENTQIVIHCGNEYGDFLSGWEVPDLIINISADGVGSVSTSISYSGIVSPDFPNLNKITIISVTGIAKHK